MTTSQEVLDAALSLPLEERLALAERLWESSGPPDPRSQSDLDAEIARRVASIDNGTAKFVSWDEARKRIAGA